MGTCFSKNIYDLKLIKLCDYTVFYLKELSLEDKTICLVENLIISICIHAIFILLWKSNDKKMLGHECSWPSENQKSGS